MILYFAGGGYDDIAQSVGANLLKTFAYRKNAEKLLASMSQPTECKVFLDSGAFSAFSKGQTIDINEYAAFIHQYKHKITCASNLDVIKDVTATRQNQKTLESLGCDILLVFHYGEPWELLKEYVKEYRYIALGGLVPIACYRTRMQTFLDKVFSITRSNSFIHGFGVSSIWAWQRYPFYSTDATTWLAGPIRREVYRWENGKMHKNDSSSIDCVLSLTEHYTKLVELNCIAFIRAAEHITKLWKARGIEYPLHHGSIKR